MIRPVFCFGQNFAKFQPEKYDFAVYKRFFMEKMTRIRQISKTLKSKSQDFYDKFQ
jgi:molybdate-binding protein